MYQQVYPLQNIDTVQIKEQYKQDRQKNKIAKYKQDKEIQTMQSHPLEWV